MPTLADLLRATPLIAILRGIRPEEAAAMAAILVDEGFGIVEVPLNSPEPLKSIQAIDKAVGRRALVGAGTVMTPADVQGVAEAGGRLIVMPHADLEVVRAAKAAGLTAIPGVATPTEAFAALSAGADALKLFPGEMVTPAVVKALRAVLPKEALLIPVGGVDAQTIPLYRAAGANAFGIGSALYAAGRPLAEVRDRARTLRAAIA